ncbi:MULTISPECIES: PLD nuclease N-terminal domain-containing protein [unclassified Geodermatophilus]
MTSTGRSARARRPAADPATRSHRSLRWADLSPRRKGVLLALGSVQLSLAVAAWTDLARRRPDQVHGRKAVWAAVIAVNWVGPLAWFRWGRRR